MDLKWLLFSFEGRINRLPYWGVALVMIALGTGFNIALGDFGPERPMTADASSAFISLRNCWKKTISG